MSNKKLIAILMSIIMVLSSATNIFAAFAKDIVVNTHPEITPKNLLTFKGSLDPSFAPHFVTWDDSNSGEPYYAYCVNPTLYGQGQVPTGVYAESSYLMDIMDKLDGTQPLDNKVDPQLAKYVWGAIANGFPSKSPQDLGVSDEYDAFYATKMAIWSLIHPAYKSLDDWQPNSAYGSEGVAVKAAMEMIVANAKTYTSNDIVITATVTPTSATTKEVGSNLEQEYSVSVDGAGGLSYVVMLDPNNSIGAKVVDMQGNPVDELTRIPVDQKFKIVAPKPSTSSYEINETFNVRVITDAPVCVYAQPSDSSISGKVQNYVLRGQGAADASGEFVALNEADQSGELLINKKDNSGKALTGAVFSFTDASGTPKPVKDGAGKDITTLTANGATHSATNLPYGTYYVKETTTPLGYTSSNKVYTFTVNEQTPKATIDVTNDTITTKYSLTIYKYATQTKENGARIPLEGVEFELVDGNGHGYGSKATDAKGTITWDNLPKGWYRAEEIGNNGLGYQLTPPTYRDITLSEDNPKGELTFYDDTSSDVTPHKVDAVTGAPIKGVEFEIHQIDGNGNWKAVGETGADGTYSFKDVPDGVYSIREVSTVEGYILDPTPQTVVVKNGQATSVKFTNSKFPGLTITKVDSQTGETITKPATFRVTQVDGTFSQDVTTQNGIATLKNIPVGAYQIQEITAPEGYVIDPTCGTVYIGKNESKQYVAKDTKKPVLTIEKIDGQTGKPISGVKFEVKKSDDTVIGTVTTGGQNGNVVVGLDGKTLLGYLDPDVYTITEIFVPEPYVIDPATKSQTIRLNAGDTKTLTFMNLQMPVITVEKYDEKTGQKLPNAQFAIYEQSDESRPIAEGLTDKDGKFTTGYVKPGTYTIRELNPPPGYMVSDKTKSERVIVAKAGDGEIIVKVDNIMLPKLIIKKIDTKTQEPLQGFTFKVTETDDTSVQPATATTNADGIIEIQGLKAGTYSIEEIACPSNYILDPTPQTVKLLGGDNKTLLFKNIMYPTLVVLKTDYETNKAIPNATFRIDYENPNGGVETVGTYKTNGDGRIILPYVKAGWYSVTEVLPAQGFQLPTNPTTRIYLKPGDNSYTSYQQGNTGGNDGNASENETPQSSYAITSGLDYPVVAGIVNYPLNSIVIKKADANTGGMLSGATFEVIKVTGQTSGQNGTLICTVTTDSSGTIIVSKLEAGAYAIKEVKAPNNYLISETNLQTVNLKADGTSVVETIFRNYPYGAISIDKVDGATGKPLKGATFKVTDNAGTVVGDNSYTTDTQGNILVSNVKPGSYLITELTAPDGYAIDTTPQTVLVGNDGKTYKVSFVNYPEGTLVINKYDSKTKEPLDGAQFKVTTSTGNVVGTGNGIFTTDSKGTIIIPSLPKGSYIVTEVKAPQGYTLSNQTQTIEINYAKTYTLDFYNVKQSGLQIIKIDANTKQPLKGAKFKIYKQNGEVVGEYETDGDGLIIVNPLENGWYKAIETHSPEGYLLDDTAKDFEVTGNQFIKLTFENKKLTGIVIKKIDDKTGIPLKGAKFTITKQNGEHVGDYETDASGSVVVPTLQPDWYIIKETRSPDGYQLDNTPQTVQVKTDVPTIATFTNKKLTSLQIKKIDASTGAPLAGAVFTVEKQNSEKVYTNENGTEFVTDAQGLINIPTLTPDYYIVREQKAPSGYTMDMTPQTVQVKTDAPTVVTFANKKMTSLQIKKVDAITGAPLVGAVFTVEKQNGEKVYTNENGTEFVTDAQGMINIPTLTPDYYVVREQKAPSGYTMDMTPQTIQVKTDSPTAVVFKNTPITGLQIKKLNSVTRQPINGVIFAVTKMNGEKIGEFTTGSDGTVFVPGLLPEQYVVTEVKAVDGYQLDASPKNVTVKAGENAYVEVLNTPDSGLLIIKTDAQTGKPLANVAFDIKRTDGQRVQGDILDKNQPGTANNSPNKSTSPNGDISGNYTTDARGRILINNLAYGEYTVTETKQLPGYELDTNVYNVTVVPGKQAVLQLQNKPLAGLKIHKVDAFTGQPIYGVEFMVFDANNKVVGVFQTDNNGDIDLSAILTEGRYTLRETKAAAGYFRDDVPRTVEFIAGKSTEITWKNVPEGGQIQITKLSKDDNEMNGIPAGTPLEGAVFEVFAYKSGNLVDRFVTGGDGRGVSKPLPLGRYTVKEAQAPSFYKLNTTPIDVTIEFATQIVKLEYTNESANVGVSIDKIGPKEVVQGQEAMYTIKTVRNNSTIPLNSFFWRDVLPTDAVRLEKIVTGTYSQSLKYKVLITTNKGNTKVIADNMMTTKNNVIGCTNAELGLPNDEYVTSFTLQFGTVKAGFSMVEEARVYTKVLKTNLPTGYQFGNKVDIGGQAGNDWVIGNATCVTTIFNPNSSQKLPKTGK